MEIYRRNHHRKKEQCRIPYIIVLIFWVYWLVLYLYLIILGGRVGVYIEVEHEVVKEAKCTSPVPLNTEEILLQPQSC